MLLWRTSASLQLLQTVATRERLQVSIEACAPASSCLSVQQVATELCLLVVLLAVSTCHFAIVNASIVKADHI